MLRQAGQQPQDERAADVDGKRPERQEGSPALAGRAIVLSGSECAPGLTGEDCAFEVTLATETARFYLNFAAGLLLIGVGLFVLLRKKKEPLP